MKAFALLLILLAAMFLIAGCDDDDDDSDSGPSEDDDDNDDVSGNDEDDDTADDDDDDDNNDTDDDDDDDDDNDSEDDDDDAADDDDDDTSDLIPTSVSGAAYRFDWTFGMLEGGRVEVFERPDILPVTTDADGRFGFDNLYAGQEVSFVIHHPEFWPTQTATLIPDEGGIDDASFQVPPKIIVYGLALVLWEALDENMCQIATTVTEQGGTPFSPGIEGVQVSINPPLPPEHGPFYFQIIQIPGWPMLDIPVRSLTETTHDGGAVFVNVPPGDYVISATSPGESYTTAYLKCRPGFLVNAAPPYGLQRIP